MFPSQLNVLHWCSPVSSVGKDGWNEWKSYPYRLEYTFKSDRWNAQFKKRQTLANISYIVIQYINDSIRGFARSLYKYPLKSGTNWETLLRKDICHIYICLTNVSVCVLPASANGERVFHQIFLNLVGNIFALREATFVSAIKANVSRYGIQGNVWANIENHELISTTMSLRLAKALV
jgi:hypothetical protein